MKEKLKIYLKIKSILIGICFVAFSCNNDDFTEPIQEQTLKKLDFTGYILPTDSIFKTNSILKNHVLGKFTKKSNELSRTLESETLGFSIDTTRVMILRSDNFDSYTFTVERENFDDTVLENYVLTYYSNNRYTQFLMSYPIIENNDGTISFDVQNATATSINDSGLLFRGVECASHAQEWQPGECFDVNCGGSTGSGDHRPGDSCDADPGDQPYSWCAPGTWVNTFCTHYISEDGGGGGNTTGGGGGGNTTNNNDQEEEEEEAVEFPTVPFDDELGLRSECKKIKRFLDNNPGFKSLIIAAANDSLNLEFEKSYSKFKDQDTIIVASGSTADDAKVRLLSHPEYIYEAFMHTHYEKVSTPQGDTYSVFSLDDLEKIADLVKLNYTTQRFVTFLSTGKGTHFALTINNQSKLLDFFDYYFNRNNPPNGGYEELNEYLDKQAAYKNISKEYYDKNFGLINASTTNNNHQDLENFLKFLDEADMGVSLFKTDASFNEFTQIKYNSNLDGNNIEETPCEN